MYEAHTAEPGHGATLAYALIHLPLPTPAGTALTYEEPLVPDLERRRRVEQLLTTIDITTTA